MKIKLTTKNGKQVAVCVKCGKFANGCRSCGNCVYCEPCECIFHCDACRIRHPYRFICMKCLRGCRRTCLCNKKQEEMNMGIVNKLNRTLGVELEMVGIRSLYDETSHYQDKEQGFHWEHDGTLTEGGMELVVAKAAGDTWVRRMGGIFDLMQEFGAKVDRTCGYHVHVGSGDLSWAALRRLIRIWGGVEGDLWGTLVRADRRTAGRNGVEYAAPLIVGSADQRYTWQFTPKDLVAVMRKRLDNEGAVKNWIVKKLYGVDLSLPEGIKDPQKKLVAEIKYQKAVQQMQRIKAYKRTNEGHGGCRYAAMNLHSHFFRGTVEFRLKEGTVDFEEIIFWAMFCGWMVESAERLEDRVVCSLNRLDHWVDAVRGFVPGSVLDWVKEKQEKRELEKCA